MLRSQTLANIHEIFSNYILVDLLYILRSSVGSSFCTHYTCLVFQIAPLNVFCHHNRHLIGHFKFLWIFEYFRKIALKTSRWKARRSRDLSSPSLLTQYNTHTCWGTTLTTKQTEPTIIIFDLGTNPVVGHVLVHFVDKIHVLVATVELLWLWCFHILTLFQRWTNFTGSKAI